MRQLNTAALEELAKTTNIEPFNVVAIQWTPGGDFLYYTDREYPGVPFDGIIIGLDTVNAESTLDGSGSAAQFSLQLSDSDGTLKSIIDNNDIHRRTVILYQCFLGIPFEDRFQIFFGEIASPIVWDEGTRILSFATITRMTDVEIGFAPESGMFPEINQDLLGKVWPLCFGTPRYVPCQALQQVPTGTISIPFGIPDPTLQLQIGEMNATALQMKEQAEFALIAAAVAEFQGDDQDAQTLNSEAAQLQDQANGLLSQAINLLITLEGQQQWEKKTNSVVGGHLFPQGKQLMLKIDETLFYGTFRGDHVTLQPIILGLDGNATGLQVYDPSKGYIPSYVKSGFTFINAGAQVTIIGDYSVTWIANLIPSTNVRVYAYRSFNGLRQIAKVPSSYYDVQILQYGTLTPTTVTLKRPLTSITFFDNEKTQLIEDYQAQLAEKTGQPRPSHLVASNSWEDQIYVVLDSDVGFNPVDIISYLVETYTDKVVDGPSFANTRTRLTNYPMNFAYFDRPNVYSAIQDIAYQSRCALWLTDNVFHIKFLPAEVDVVATITPADVFQKTLQVTTTSTEDVITKYVANWKPDYLHEQANQLTLRRNIAKYGLVEQDFDYYCLTDLGVVHKVASFWTVRKSTTWKRMTCQMTLRLLGLEVFDTVLLDFGDKKWVADGPVKALVESITYNSLDVALEVSFWLPIQFGTMTYFPFAWPADLTETTLFPFYYAITGGNSGSGQFVEAAGGILPAYNGAASYNPEDLDGPINLNELPTGYYHPAQQQDTTQPDRVVRYTSPGNSSPRTITIHDPVDWIAKLSDVGDTPPEAIADDPDVTPTTEPTFSYEYKGTDPITTPQQEQTQSSSIPGFVVSGSGDTYQVRIYPKGLGQTPKTVTVKQLQINSGATIPPDTGVLVAQLGANEYYMQVPVWLFYTGP